MPQECVGVELFPEDGMGEKLLYRSFLVSQTAKVIMEIAQSGLPSKHYFRGLPGTGFFAIRFHFKLFTFWFILLASGKTTFAKLLGVELARSYNCASYYLADASDLDKIGKHELNALIKSTISTGKYIVITIDEVQRNVASGRWTDLLKANNSKLIVIGFGLAIIDGSSVAFPEKYKYKPDYLMVSTESEDINELIRFWRSKRLNLEEKTIREICVFICKYTGGNMYSLLRMTTHIFTEMIGTLVMTDEKILEVYQSYIGSEFFYEQVACNQIIGRCFRGYIIENYSLFQAILARLSKDKINEAITKLERNGYWNEKKRSFVSSLLIRHIYDVVGRHQSEETDKLLIDMNMEKQGIILEIIKGGLQKMRNKDFCDDKLKLKIENAIGICWAYHVRSAFDNIHISPQIRGVSGYLDFHFNGAADVAIELMTEPSGTNTGLTNMNKHCERFSPRKYHWRNNAIFNINLKNNTIVLPDRPIEEVNEGRQTYLSSSDGEVEYYDHAKVYTYIRQYNSLYRGDKLVASGVVKAFPTLKVVPPIVAFNRTHGVRRFSSGSRKMIMAIAKLAI